MCTGKAEPRPGEVKPTMINVPNNSGSTRKRLKDPWKFYFQIFLATITLFPMILWYKITSTFFTKNKSVRGKVVLITGAGAGFGRGLAFRFADLGCKIACVDIDTSKNEDTLKLLNEKYPGCAKGYYCNVALADDIRALKIAVEKDFECINVLINNAGIVYSCKACGSDDQFIQTVVAVNLTSHLLMIKTFLPDMLKRNEGHIVAVSSLSAFSGLKNLSLYAATKHGILGLMESLWLELNEIPGNKVKASIACPYFMNTDPAYQAHWDLRIPALSVNRATRECVDGILKDKRIIAIPSHMFFSTLFLRMLPVNLSDRLRKIVYTRLDSIEKEEVENSALHKNLQKSFDTLNSEIEYKPATNGENSAIHDP